MSRNEQMLFHYKSEAGTTQGAGDTDPITTEIVRNALISVADQMKRVLIRTAFSPVIYDMTDYAIAIYDAQYRMMAQANSLPAFMGTLSFCCEAAVAGVGGPDKLKEGDVIVYNEPYGTGSHAQDLAVVVPIFYEGKLVGYSANKAHQLDIGAKDPYCTDTTDVFQEGMVLPGVKLFEGGRLVESIQRIMLANSRMPRAMEGDLNAQVSCANTGVELVKKLIARQGAESFWTAVERMYDHGERMMRSFIEEIPDGRYVAVGHMDDNGVDTDRVEFEIAVEIRGSNVIVDFSNAPDAQRGPINCPMPSSVSLSRVAIAMLAGFDVLPNEGHFRPLEVITRPGSMFHPVKPQPCYLYGWAFMSAHEAINQAVATARAGLVPSGSNGDICAVLIWGGGGPDRDPWLTGSSLAGGHGAHDLGDGSIMYTASLAFATMVPIEVEEAKQPVTYWRTEITPDSGGAGRHRGGHGWQRWVQLLEDGAMISTVERTQVPAWAQLGGKSGRPNGLAVLGTDGKEQRYGKATNVKVPAGSIVKIEVGGGGGYGPPSERDPAAVLRDMRDGYITEAHVREHYPHVQLA